MEGVKSNPMEGVKSKPMEGVKFNPLREIKEKRGKVEESDFPSESRMPTLETRGELEKCLEDTASRGKEKRSKKKEQGYFLIVKSGPYSPLSARDVYLLDPSFEESGCFPC